MTHELVEFGIAHGRFQPPHREHIEYLISVKRFCRNLVVAVTNPILNTVQEVSLSPHRHESEANPFTFFDRQIMIRNCLLDEGLSAREFSIIPFDLFSPGQWSSFIPAQTDTVFFVRVFSDWERSKMALFEQFGYRVHQIDPGCIKGVTATDVRHKIISNGNWRKLVPPATARFIEKSMKEDGNAL